MALTDYVIREKLPELWRQIDSTHLSYLETDDSPQKLDQRKKLEGYILDYLYLVPHENKFTRPETAQVLSKSALLPGFSAFRLARGWVALARYASNLLAQPWRKEYHTIRLYSGYYKHEVEGSGLSDAEDMLKVMGYRLAGPPNCLTLDGPICPDLVSAVSRDSLIAYVECQIMIKIWEEVSLRGGDCSWLEVLRCREEYPCDVDQAAAIIIYSQSNNKDIYSNVKFGTNPHTVIKNNLPYSSYDLSPPQVNDYAMMQQSYNTMAHNGVHGHCVQPTSNGYVQNGHTMMGNSLAAKGMAHGGGHLDPHGMYCPNPLIQDPHLNQMNGVPRGMHQVNPMYRFNTNMMGQCVPMSNYYYNPMTPHPYLMPAPVAAYGPVKHATTLPLSNGYHYPMPAQPAYCPTVPTGQLIELDLPTYPIDDHIANMNVSSQKQSIKRPDNGHGPREHIIKIQHSGSVDSKNNLSHSAAHNAIKKSHELSYENQENARRNSAPRSSASYASDLPSSIPRSDTQPSLSKAREDGVGTFENWDYVFRNLESQGYSKDLGERGNILSPPIERDSKTLGRVGSRDPKRYQQTTMDLEDGLQAISLGKDSDEELYRTAKINETLLKIKQDNEAKVAKANSRRLILADEKDKRKTSSYENAPNSPVKESPPFKVINDKVRLITKEEARDKKEMDKTVYTNGNNTNKIADNRKVKKNIVKCLSSEMDTNTKKKKPTAEQALPSMATSKKIPTHPQVSVNSSNHHVRHQSQGFDSADGSLNTRLVVSLHDQEKPPKRHGRDAEQQSSRGASEHGSEQGKREDGGKWECGACTYRNPPSRGTCEMCCKSRQVGVEAQPLVSGGKECPQCTLVNTKDASACAVCGTDLKHSPTYI